MTTPEKLRTAENPLDCGEASIYVLDYPARLNADQALEMAFQIANALNPAEGISRAAE